jgi:hypothetical protein
LSGRRPLHQHSKILKKYQLLLTGAMDMGRKVKQEDLF